METLSALFAHVCGQQHCWVMGDTVLPLCQRCTGTYVGGAFALCWVAVTRPFPSAWMLRMHALLLLVMVPFGYHLVAHGATMRTATGLLFGFGVSYCLALNPATRVGAFVRCSRTRNTIVYWVGLILFVPTLLFAVHSRSYAAALIVSFLALAGLVSYAVLAVANIVVLSRMIAVPAFRRREKWGTWV